MNHLLFLLNVLQCFVIGTQPTSSGTRCQCTQSLKVSAVCLLRARTICRDKMVPWKGKWRRRGRSCKSADCFPEHYMVVSKKVHPSPESTCTPPVRASVCSASFQGWMSERLRVGPSADRTSPRGANQGFSEAGMLRRWLQGRVQPTNPRTQTTTPTVDELHLSQNL